MTKNALLAPGLMTISTVNTVVPLAAQGIRGVSQATFMTMRGE